MSPDESTAAQHDPAAALAELVAHARVAARTTEKQYTRDSYMTGRRHDDRVPQNTKNVAVLARRARAEGRRRTFRRFVEALPLHELIVLYMLTEYYICTRTSEKLRATYAALLAKPNVREEAIAYLTELAEQPCSYLAPRFGCRLSEARDRRVDGALAGALVAASAAA